MFHDFVEAVGRENAPFAIFALLLVSMFLFGTVGLLVRLARTPSRPSEPKPPEPNIYDVDDARDDNLQPNDDEVAALLYFYATNNEVCSGNQTDALEAFSRSRNNIAIYTVDVMWGDNSPLVVLYGVRHVPTFVLRKKGDTGYHTLIGPQTHQQLADFVESRMQQPDPAAAAK